MKQKMKNNMEKTLEAAVSFPLPHVVIPRKFSVTVTLLLLGLLACPALPEIGAKIFYTKGGSGGAEMSQTNMERVGLF